MELKYSEWTENPLWLEGAEWTKVDGFKWRQPNGGHKKKMNEKPGRMERVELGVLKVSVHS